MKVKGCIAFLGNMAAVCAVSWMLFLPVDSRAAMRTVVAPIQVHAETEMTYLQKGIQDVLVSRISAISGVVVVDPAAVLPSGSPARFGKLTGEMRSLLQQQQVDYAVFGSLSIIGSQGSLDIQAVRIRGKSPARTFYRKIESLDDVIPATEAIAREIEVAVFDKKIAKKPSASIAGKEIEALPEGPDQPADWKPYEMAVQIVGLGTGDVDGNGIIDIAAASERDVHLLAVNGNQPAARHLFRGKSYHHVLALDAGDLNRNGRAEIYLSCEHAGSGSLVSMVLEWDGDQLVPILADQDWMFRLVLGMQEATLLGQKKGMSTAFFPEVVELSWQAGRLVPGKRVTVPDDVMVFGVSAGDAADGQTKLTAAFRADDRLAVLDTRGRVIWKSHTPFGGRERFIKAVSAHQDRSGERFFLPQRTIFLPDRTPPAVLTLLNDSSSGRWFEKFRQYSHARFLWFDWDGRQLTAVRRSAEITGYVSDFSLADLNRDGRNELVYAVVEDRESAFRNAKSDIVIRDLIHFLQPGDE